MRRYTSVLPVFGANDSRGFSMRATAVAKSGYTPVATAAQIAAPRLAPPGPLARDAGIPKTSAKICMKSGLDEPPPEITTSRSGVPSSSVMRVDLVLHRERDRLED